MRILTGTTALLSILLTSAIVAAPTVVIETEMVSDGFGSRGIGKMKSTQHQWIQKDRAREESSSELTGKFLSKFSGDQSEIRITRLDKDLMYGILSKKKKYTEISFEELRRQREEGMAGWKQQMQGNAAPPSDDSEGPKGMTFSPPEITVERPGDKQSIAGFESELVKIVGTSVGTHEETGQTCEVRWLMDLWVAETPGAEIVRSYRKGVAEALGFSQDQLEGLGSQVSSMISSYGKGLQELQKEMAEIDKTPLRTRMALETEGTCGIAGGMAAADTSDGPPEDEEPAAAPGRKFGKFGKKMLGKFKRGKNNDQEQQQEPQEAPSQIAQGPQQMFAFTVNTLSYELTDAGEIKYLPPSDFKRIDGKR